MRRPDLFRRGAALALALLLLTAPLTALAAPAGEDAIYIRSAADWAELVRRCRLDSWSQGKTVYLTCDIDAAGLEAIPIFQGTLEGNGHSIKGVHLTGEGSRQGLIRRLEAGGSVRDLTVWGTVAPAGSCESVGGIVGVNCGTLYNCRFEGAVEGVSAVGGLAGVNEAGGEILTCSAAGRVVGEHSTGGVAGENYGSIVRCISEAEVNTAEARVSPELDDLSWDRLRSTEAVPACTDTGGIAGYSKGVIQSCANRGAVGYPHTGYNVGGIVGRQQGYVEGCVNLGRVEGRKDVGGIAGQMEPYTLLRYEEDTLQSLLDALSDLSGLMDSTLDHTDSTRRQLSDQLSAVNDLAGTAREDILTMTEDLADLADGTMDTANDLTARVSRVIDRLVPVTEDLEDCAGDMADAMEELERAALTMLSASGEGEEAAAALEKALSALRGAAEDGRGALTRLAEALRSLRDGVGGGREETALLQAGEALGELSGALSAGKTALSDAALALEGGPFDDLAGQVAALSAPLETLAGETGGLSRLLADPSGDLEAVLAALAAAMEDLGGAGEQAAAGLRDLDEAIAALKRLGAAAEAALRQVRRALGDLGDGMDAAAAAVRGLGDILEEQSRMPELVWPKISPTFREAEDRLGDTLEELGRRLDTLNDTAGTGGDRLGDDLRAVNGQFARINRILQDAADREDTDQVVDASQEEAESAMGTVSGCTNRGSVEGDVNVGGLAGTLAVEFDYDPEEDLAREGERSLRYQYLTYVVLRRSVNEGSVTARRDCVGGGAGLMELGLLSACENYGAVESTGGSYAGGIAGRSAAAVRNCWAKCPVRGSRYVGGVAGLGTDIAGCRTLVELDGGPACLGAIAGEAEGTVTENLFVSETLGGVDGVSYAGKAQPVTYEELMELEDVPAPFSHFSLTFTADGEAVAIVPFAYGEALPDSRLPQVPERPGCCGTWQDFDRDRLLFDREIEAVYTPYLPAIASVDGRFLAEGAFSPDAVLTVSPVETPPPGGRVLGRWRLEAEEGFDAVRLPLPEEGRAVLWRLNGEDGWEKLDYTVEGSFLRAQITGTEAVLCVTLANDSWLAGAGILCALCVGAAAVVLVRRRKGRRKEEKAPASAGS